MTLRRAAAMAVSSVFMLSIPQAPAAAWAQPAKRLTVTVEDTTAPNIPTVTSFAYPEGQASGWNASARSFTAGWFVFRPNGSADVAKYDYAFSDGTTGTVEARQGGSAAVRWKARTFGPHDLQVKAFDEAGNAGETRTYAFQVEQPPRDALWSMDETSGAVAAAVDGSGQARPDADIALVGDPVRGDEGNHGAALPEDRSVRFNGSGQYGEVEPAVHAGFRIPLVDTSKRFMFSTWVRPDSTSGDQVAISQAAADGSVFELGWLGGRWAFRHRTADGTVLATVVRDLAAAPDGSPWTEHWVSLMAGYDPVNKLIWLRTQAEGRVEVCPSPDAEPWECTTERVMAPQTATAADEWTPQRGTGSLLLAAAPTATGKGSYWSGRIDDTQMWPLTHEDESVLRVIYGE